MGALDRPHRQPAQARSPHQAVQVLHSRAQGPTAHGHRLTSATPDFAFIQFDLPAGPELSDARYLLRDEEGEPEAVVVVRDGTVTVVDPSSSRPAAPRERPVPSKEDAVFFLQRALEEYGALTGQPAVDEVRASGWRAGYGSGEQVAEGKAQEVWDL